ncbi:transcriptional regulator [Paractinoplanes deccanensis]|uniref:Transcriptional regulator n=1 Tax=Paractinoplanes deccanensis TaxID=113561 RepID=A0ABQ3YM33_9ACTN|nr:helix-turn-helix domain-containing protein [Actinoplanes deccanensis]GID81062.1 transcriptional regulator [Actinoplanes deccanensis]
MSEVTITDAALMRVMAHPLRMRIVGSLRVDGPATSAILARRLGTDSGQTSHHLRLLARHGFVADAPELGRGAHGRERWWRAAHATTVFDGDNREDGVAVERASRTAWGAWIEAFHAQVAQGRWSEEWQRAADGSDQVIRTTPERLDRLREQIWQLVEQARTNEPGAEQVLVVLQTYPHRAS